MVGTLSQLLGLLLGKISCLEVETPIQGKAQTQLLGPLHRA